MIDWPIHYILKGKTPVAVSVHEWARWATEQEGGGFGIKVAYDAWDNIVVSTVFLPIDHNYHNDGAPLVFETMVFRGGDAGECVRSSTWDEAEKVHREVMTRLRFRVIEGGRRA